MRSRVWSGSSNGICATPVGGCSPAPQGTQPQLCKAVDELPQRLGRSPTIAELAAHLEVTEEEALEALEVAGTRVDCSLDAPLGDAEEGSLGDLVAAPTAREECEDLLLVPELLVKLPAVEREVVLLRFFLRT